MPLGRPLCIEDKGVVMQGANRSHQDHCYLHCSEKMPELLSRLFLQKVLSGYEHDAEEKSKQTKYSPSSRVTSVCYKDQVANSYNLVGHMGCSNNLTLQLESITDTPRREVSKAWMRVWGSGNGSSRSVKVHHTWLSQGPSKPPGVR